MSIAIALLPVALAGMIAAPAAAQTASDDVRCLLLSAGYARQTKDDNARHAASMTGAFFLGRLSGRLSDDALAAAVRAQGLGISGKEAEPIMRACAARAAAAEQNMSRSIQKAQPGH